jgi:hypothetical protein
MTARILACSLALAAALWPGASRADEASEAKLQFELGQELYKQKRLPEAIDRFIASNRLVPNANIVFNIANTYVVMAKGELKRRAPAKADEHFVEAYNWTETFLRFEGLPEVERQDGVKLRDSLVPRVALIDVTSNPPGADIVIDREALGSVGRAPRVLATSPGDHTVILKAPGYRDGKAPAAARLGGTVTVRVDLERILGTLQVDSHPPGARVQLEGGAEALGVTPFAQPLPVGTVRINVSKDGYLAQTRDVAIADGVVATLALTLQPTTPTVATLSVTGTPASATVVLDGRPVGQVPTSAGNLSPGRGRLEIIAPSHQAWSGDVPLEAGGATRVAIRLAPEEKAPWPGWKWLGYGGGAACLAAGLLVGLAARSAHDDFVANPSGEKHDRVGTLNLTADVLLATGVTALVATTLVRWLWPPPKTSQVDVAVQR